MADKTFGVKVSEELYDKVKLMIDGSGDTSKEWFEKAVALIEMNSIKEGATDYSQDLSELEVHTTRIYELISNMVQRSIYIKDHAVKEVVDKLEQKEKIISDYQEKTKSAVDEAQAMKEIVASLEKEKNDLLKQLEEQRSVNHNNQLLIDEYKEKNDTLNGLVTKYQSFAEENEKLKEEFSIEKAKLDSQVKEVMSQNDSQQEEIKELKSQIETTKTNHSLELDRLIDKKDLEKEKAIIDVERNFQDKLLKANEGYSEKINALYKEVSTVRKEYEGKIQALENKHKAELKSLEESKKK